MEWARGRVGPLFEAQGISNKKAQGAQLVLFGVADRANEHGVTWVGQETLAADCSCCESHVRRALTLLENVGLIARVRRNGAGGHRTSDYTIVAPGASDRGKMVDAPADGWLAAPGLRLPSEVVSLATQQPGSPLGPSPNGHADVTRMSRVTRLPSRQRVPTDSAAGPYRAGSASLPTQQPGEQLVEHQVERPVESSSMGGEAPPHSREVRAKPALGVRENILFVFDDYRTQTSRPNVEFTEARRKAIGGRLTRDSFTVQELQRANAGARRALSEGALDHPSRDTDVYRVHMDANHVRAWIEYGETGDYTILSELLLAEFEFEDRRDGLLPEAAS